MIDWRCILLLMWCSIGYAQINLQDRLVACYPFSGNANDQTGNGHHCVVNGPVLTQDRFGNVSSAYLFDGQDDFMEVSDWSGLCPNDEVSICFWSKAITFKSQFAFSLAPENSSLGRMAIQVNYKHSSATPSTFWDYANIGNGRVQIVPDPYVSDWEHYVFVASKSNNILRIYRNGVQIASKAYGDDLPNRTRNLLIGELNNTTIGSHFNFHGIIDDILIYNRELNPQEVNVIFQGTPVCSQGPDPSPNPCRLEAMIGTEDICFGEPAHFEDFSTDSLYDVVFWKWNLGDGTVVNGIQNPIHTYNEPGNYMVILEVKNDSINPCTDLDTAYIEIKSPPEINLGNDTSICYGIPLYLLSSDDGNLYQWSTGSNSNSIFIQSEGIFWVDVKNECGTDTDSIEVEIDYCGCRAELPNAFTPNGDGVNEYFAIYSSCVFENFNFIILNRWGEIIFESDDQHFRWYGIQKSTELPSDTYVYRMKYTYWLNNEYIEDQRRGKIILLR